MKTTVKYMMGPLLFGGLIISLYFTISACRRSADLPGKNLTCKQLTACRTPVNDAPAFCIRILKKLIMH